MAVKSKYGLEWDLACPDVMIELGCAKHWREIPELEGHPADHLLRACRMLFKPAEFTIHKWTEQHALDFTESDF